MVSHSWFARRKLGDRVSLDRLAEGARQRLYAYIYPVDAEPRPGPGFFLQETLLKVVENIKELEHPDRFWNWLFRTALGTASITIAISQGSRR